MESDVELRKLNTRLEVDKVEILSELDTIFRRYVQTKELLQELEGEIQRYRGIIDGLDKARERIATQIDAERLEKMREEARNV